MIAAADSNGHDLSSLRQYLVGAAPVPASLIERCQAQGLAVSHCYGSSEPPTVTSRGVGHPLANKLHTAATPIAWSATTFVDDDGHTLPSGVAGDRYPPGPELFPLGSRPARAKK